MPKTGQLFGVGRATIDWCSAQCRALVVRRPAAGLVVHSDQPRQYTATRFNDLVTRHGAVQNMSRRGNCYGNAPAESFWSRFKAELLNGDSFLGLAEAKLEISHHIADYNAERRHSALTYHSPNHFETRLQTTSQCCAALLGILKCCTLPCQK